MRFRFLGTGTSAGIPAIGCECPVCLSQDPRDRRLRTSASLEFSDARGRPRVILLDAGPDLRQQALHAGLRRLDAILFTHNHVDHTFGLDEVRRFNAIMRAPIDIYAEQRTLQHLQRVYPHIFDKRNNVNDSFVATLIAHPIEPEQTLELFGLRVRPLRLLHGRLPILGYRFDPADDSPAAGILPLVYCTDVSSIPPESWRSLQGARTLVLDALRKRHHPTHLTLDRAVEIAERANADHTWFVHMAHDLPHEATNATLPERMALAWDGLVLGDNMERPDQ